ncbi:VapC toxin family PIN domain ribonuclease [Caulobacter flavus]|uniref:VapC toxin family PIN domain ribonuclease n=1 Tax=Caulobacter flavus TaxID=1679497 RepID=A0A2N5CVF0_9CAUL|nr:type II toxin-antitoxin system VapC family toxin [Caulobacter flavus]AYV46873.1 VapC toxin family PIN domain ribonuclease [Caulobacter flavus]PLR17781.1 VapC toxin family PIN domain ribonuclease [Caulobacter flavus]
MIIDTSAFIAITLDEPEREAFYSLIRDSWVKKMSVASYLECAEVYFRKFDVANGLALLDTDIAELGITIVAVTAQQGFIAAQARRAYGKGRHRANLNYGDCFSYALAKVMEEPLLYKGDDFAHTDIRSVS